MTLLGIDTSGKTASVTVCSENTVLAQNTVYTKLTHSQVILPICRDVLKNAGLESPFGDSGLKDVCRKASQWLNDYDLSGIE